jgi:hypothetical protein
MPGEGGRWNRQAAEDKQTPGRETGTFRVETFRFTKEIQTMKSRYKWISKGGLYD